MIILYDTKLLKGDVIMKNKLIKKVTAAALAFALIGGAAAFPAGDKPLFDSALTVKAATSTVTFDSSTGVLTLHGNVIKEDVHKWSRNGNVKKVVCEEGTVFPEDSSWFFEWIWAKEFDLSNADTSKVTNMYGMFATLIDVKTLDLSSFDTSNVTDMKSMFSLCNSLESVDLSSFDTSKVTDMRWMFDDCYSLRSLNLSGFTNNEVISIHEMFMGCSSLERIYVSDKWTVGDTDALGYLAHNMFIDCEKLVGGNGTKYDPKYIDEKRACIDTPDTPGYLTAFNTPQAMVSITGDAALNIIVDMIQDVKRAKLSGPNGDKIITDFSQKDENGNVRFSYPVNATQFGDRVSLTLYGDDDSDIIYQTHYSINDYIDSAAEYISDDKALALTKALDNFGKAADNYFNGSKNIIEGIGNVNADSVKDYAPTFGTDDKLSLVLDSTTALRLYTESSNVLIDGNGATAKFKGKKKYYEISNIYAQNLCDKHKVTIDGVEYEFSPMSYVYRVLNNENASDKLIDMAKATYVYAKAAEAYIGK